MLQWLQTIVVVWLGVGALVAVPFLAVGIGRAVDAGRGSSLMFRLMMLPGAALLWPVVLHRWLAAGRQDTHA